MDAQPKKKLGLKRKLGRTDASRRKKIKVQHQTADELPWKSVSRPSGSGSGFDGLLELEEIEDVEVVYEDTEGGRVARFLAAKDSEVESAEGEASSDEELVDEEQESFDSETLLPEWHLFSLHPQLLQSLHSQGFSSPTPIQAAAIPFAAKGRDVIGIAQTGSGKTLAYGLPILNHLLSKRKTKKRTLSALILAPTRELALQISSHLNACFRKEQEESGSSRKPPAVSVAAIVGGMSAQKQRRILDRGVDVLVATPGRLWDLIGEDDNLAKSIKHIKFLVLDEADRMIESGHFLELENILRLTLLETSEDLIEGDDAESAPNSDTRESGDVMQTFIFSATLSKDLQRNVKARARPKPSAKGRNRAPKAPASTLVQDDLLLRLDFRDPDPQVIDLSPDHGIVSSLTEGKIECLVADKDVYLYYFLLRYPGRTLVFLSSIDGIRRLMPLTELLNVKAFPLHSQLEQRQRLKNLDRFKNTPNSLLLATDIAARGLDIAAVDHVIHYQIPRSADTYIHRNGRTARAMRSGFSMLMCAPDERKMVKALLNSLGRQESEIPEVQVDLGLLDKLKVRVQLARQIETSQHKIKKANHDRNWLKETAEAMELEIDEDLLSDDDAEGAGKGKRKARNGKNAALKAQLKHLLAQPLLARGVSTRYITSGSNPIVESLLGGSHNETFLGLDKSQAGMDVIANRKRKSTR
ncbi:ATP-dependent RNA helicase [Mycena floridula]|nr:ATP-dependent RNA helicase [Mycena floridula]